MRKDLYTIGAYGERMVDKLESTSMVTEHDDR